MLIESLNISSWIPSKLKIYLLKCKVNIRKILGFFAIGFLYSISKELTKSDQKDIRLRHIQYSFVIEIALTLHCHCTERASIAKCITILPVKNMWYVLDAKPTLYGMICFARKIYLTVIINCCLQLTFYKHYMLTGRHIITLQTN